MSWKKHFTVYGGVKTKNSGSLSNNRFPSWLPEVYSGMPNRVERYAQYDQMDMDSEVNSALDIISEFSTQLTEQAELPFEAKFNDDVTESETAIIEQALRQWCKLQDWDKRIFRTFRNAIKYGDQFFIRDPETWKLYYVNPVDVSKCVINEAKGKEPEQYVVKNLDLNLKGKTVSKPVQYGQTYGSVNTQMRSQTNYAGMGGAGGVNYAQGAGNIQEFNVDAKHVIHVGLTDGMDGNFPFGTSILDPLFKTFKQKELLEDSIIIYRVQRAPERRVFYVDTGDMPPHLAMGFVERVKNEIHQKRIPSKTGGGASMMDSSYNPLCLAMDTTVPLLDGRTLTIEELAHEYDEGKENWTYSCDPITGKIVPGNITWAGVTRKDASVIKLTFDDGSTLTCTPDHKIPVLGKGFVEAQNLSKDDSLISYQSREQGLSSSSTDRTYTQVYDHSINDWVYSHRMVGSFFRNMNKHQEFTYLNENAGAHKSIIHHRDFNRYNNDPRNLQWMNRDDHIRYHQDQNMWSHMTEDESNRVKSKISASVKKRWMDGTYDIENIRKAQKKAVFMRQNDPETKAKYHENMSASRKRFFERNPNFISEYILPYVKTWAENIPNQQKVYTFEQLQALYDLGTRHDFKLKDILAAKDEHGDFVQAVRDVNQPKQKHNFKINVDTLTQQVAYDTIRHFGYKNWLDFKRKRDQFNHRIVDIEWIKEPMDVGTITIDGNERWHDYHTFPVNNSIFVKNSILEDYFFPQTGEGRGSKVEVLPGGDNLGDIDDLKYFNNKMARALRVPSSYLPTGPDDGSATYVDGRVGTAFIQEYRFNQYCKRLQSIISPVLDREFKRFMKYKGLSIDSSIFELRFVEPQSFSTYKEIEIHSARANVFGALEGVPYMSRRFILEKYLGWTQSEILENERMWEEEHEEGVEPEPDAMPGLGAVGVRGFDVPGGEPPMDMMGPEGTEAPPEAGSPISGAESPTPGMGVAPPAGPGGLGV
jgi:hypothetical protein